MATSINLSKEHETIMSINKLLTTERSELINSNKYKHSLITECNELINPIENKHLLITECNELINPIENKHLLINRDELSEAIS